MSKLLSVAIPCYNSQAYMKKAIESVLPAGDDVEILIVNDGSTKDDTAKVADDFAASYPGIVRALHKENGGHGDAVMTGLRNATGLYFKVLDSDDWFNTEAFIRVVKRLKALTEAGDSVDLLLTNFVYDKVGQKHKFAVRYTGTLPEDRVFGWDDTRPFKLGRYIQMHSIIYRTGLLRECGLELPKHTFYVDEIYACVPLLSVERMMYMNEDVYHYFIGREDQSVQEGIMIKRIDQALKVNKILLTTVKLNEIANPKKQRYMLRYLEIITTVASVLLIKSGTPENLQKKEALWAFVREAQPDLYPVLRHRLFGRVVHLPGRVGRGITILAYKLSRLIFGFN